MRAAVALLVTVAVAGCGGGSKTKPTLKNEAEPVAETWTAGRALAALPPDTSAVFRLDTTALRESPVLGAFYEKFEASAMSMYKGPCAEVKDLKMTMLAVMSGTEDTLLVTVWLLDTPTAQFRTCIEQTASKPPAGLTMTSDGDFAAATSAEAPDFAGAILILDDRNAVMTFGRRPKFDRSDVQAAIAKRNDAPRFPELDQLAASNAPVWAFGAGSAPMFGKMPVKFRTATATVGLSQLVSLDARVRMVDADSAASLAANAEQQTKMLVGMGLVEELTTKAEGDSVVVHVAISKASIDKMISMAAMFGNSGGGSNPFGPPPPPTP